ncbi:PorT family protein [Dyadobacter sp. CY323]|uniref:PorT family protein n=1 Tax=Dyadobacter sp. CY323 TaxID=2907302 RepID=UPI001F3510E6|nr:PorT family protein [Dyadobacter sp. CY323]MCE6990556.1 PorT family protein [Dyadobacter sp. CY323]
MIELPDDELDKLFRKSSEELDPQFDPEDWNSLKKRLDETDGKTPAAWFRKWWPLGLLLLMIPGGIASYYLFGNEEKNQVNEQIQLVPGSKVTENKSAAQEQTNAKIIEKIDKEALTNAAQEKENTEPSISPRSEKDTRTPESSLKSDLKAVSSKSSKTLPRSLSKAGGVYLEPNRSKREGGDGALSLNADEKVHKNDPNGTSASELGARQAIGSNGVTPNRTEMGGNADATNMSPVNVQQNEVISADDQLDRMQITVSNLGNKQINWANRIDYPVIAVTEAEPDANQEKSKESIEISNAKWAVRFGYSPDLSTVGMKDFTKPGTAVSLLVEYSIVPRLFVQTGAVWSSKGYYGDGKSYKLPLMQDPHYYGPDVKSVDGFCKVLEIPLNLRYDVLQIARSSIFAGGGFSSYHMNKEKYKYSFENEMDPKIKMRSWNGKTGWYWFSHLNVSAGYEYKISQKLSLLAEPYLRVPLKRVGYGKVNLFTTGMWLSLRYTPAFR